MTKKVRTQPRSLHKTLPLWTVSAMLLTQACSPAEQEENNSVVQSAAQNAAALRSDPLLRTAVQSSTDHLMGLRNTLGLDVNSDFRPRSAVADEFGAKHIRYDQMYRGVRVWAGDVIVEVGANGAPKTTTNTLKPGINLATIPSLTQAQVLEIAHNDLRPVGPYAHARTAELVVYPQVIDQVRENPMRGLQGELNALDIEEVVSGYTLAYHVHTELENGAQETRHTDYIINAHTGEILKQWDSLETGAAVGTGKSQYSSNVMLGTSTAAAGGFELRDVARSMNIETYNMENGTGGSGKLVTDADNTWGDSANYIKTPTSRTEANTQTAAVDAHYGTERTFDYYSLVHGRNGIDGAGLKTTIRVHYSSNYDNAFWSDSCFCMTYGDGNTFTVLTSLDVAGHEMTHGVTSRTANLTYSGESGGLNEAMSDIHGTMVEFYARGGSGSTIGNTGGNWDIGEQLNATALRFMKKPSKDGRSKDAWYSGLGGIDVHYSSGPLNRAFYFLSQGASSVSGDETYSTYLPGGMTGIGNDKAARIAFRALATKLTASSKYANARTAFLDSAKDLYGDTGPEYLAVQNAFTAINVGETTTDTVKPTTSVTAPAPGAMVSGTTTITADATDNVAVTKVEFYAGTTLIGSSTSKPYSIAWNTGIVANGMVALTTKASDAAGNVGVSAAVTVNVNNMGTDTTPPTTSVTAPTAGSTVSGTTTVSANAMDNVAVSKVDFYAGTTLIGSDTSAPYSIAWNTTTVSNGSYVITTKASDAKGNVGTSAPVSVTVKNGGSCTSSSQLLNNPGFESGNVGWTTSAGIIDGTHATSARTGTWFAWMNGYGTARTDTMYQQVTIPSTACTASLSFWLAIKTAEVGTRVYDKLTVTVQDTTGKVLGTLGSYSNVNAGAYSQKTFNLAAYKGKTIRIHFSGVEDSSAATSFQIDDAAVNITQ